MREGTCKQSSAGSEPSAGVGGKCQQRTPPTLSTLRACGVSLVDVVSVGVGEVEREKQLGGKMEEESEKDSLIQGNIQQSGKR